MCGQSECKPRLLQKVEGFHVSLGMPGILFSFFFLFWNWALWRCSLASGACTDVVSRRAVELTLKHLSFTQTSLKEHPRRALSFYRQRHVHSEQTHSGLSLASRAMLPPLLELRCSQATPGPPWASSAPTLFDPAGKWFWRRKKSETAGVFKHNATSFFCPKKLEDFLSSSFYLSTFFLFWKQFSLNKVILNKYLS